MAAKKRSRGDSSEGRGWAIVLEEMQSQFGVFGEALQGLREHMDVRFERVEGRLDRVEGRLDRVEGRLDKVEGRLDKVEEGVGLLKVAVLDNARAIAETRQVVLAKLDTKIDREECDAMIDAALARR